MSQVGLRDLHFAVMTQDEMDVGVDYDAPVRIAGAINATINPTVNTQELFADDQLWEAVSALGAVDVEIETAEMSLATRAMLLGKTLVAGVLVEDAEVVVPHVALGFRSMKSNGDFRYVWLLKGVPQPIAEEFATQTDNIDHKTPRMRFTFMPRLYDQQWKYTADTDEGSGFTGADTWFDAVPSYVPYSETITITTQPTNATVTEGSITESLTVAASVTGEGSVTYQWYSNSTASNVGGSLIEAATAASFTIPTDLTEGTYYYYCVVSSANAASVASAVATVTVEPA